MPTSSLDTFFACSILVAAALIGTAFLGSTMQTRMASTQDINKDSYLKAIADQIVTNPGSPVDWGTSSALPADFGLATASSTGPYDLDLDKISRLNALNNYSLSYADVQKSAKLSNIALGISVSQLMTLNVLQASNSTVGGGISFNFTVSASIDSKPTSAILRGYVMAENYLTDVNGTISESGIGQVTIRIPAADTSNALLILFARASSINDRITSYAIFNFADSTQESIPSSTSLDLTPLNYTLRFNQSSSDITVQNGYVFSYSYQQTLASFEGGQTSIPKLIDQSPIVLSVFGFNGAHYFQEWIAYPQVPMRAGANFVSSEQNLFSYIVTVNGVLCRLDVGLGDLPR